MNQDQHDNHAHEDLYVAIRDAFNVAERQFKSIDKKHRATPLHQKIEAMMLHTDPAEKERMDEAGVMDGINNEAAA